jgi:hypothetical protein
MTARGIKPHGHLEADVGRVAAQAVEEARNEKLFRGKRLGGLGLQLLCVDAGLVHQQRRDHLQQRRHLRVSVSWVRLCVCVCGGGGRQKGEQNKKNWLGL